MYATIATTILLASIQIRVHALEKAAKDAEDEFTASSQATELAKNMEATVATATSRATEFTKAATKLRIMAASQTASMATASYTAAAEAAKTALEILTKVTEQTPKINKAASALRASANTAELLSVLKSLTLSDKPMAAANSYNTQDRRPLSFTLANDNGACMESKDKRAAAKEGPASKNAADHNRITLVTANLRTSDGDTTKDLFLCSSNSQTAFGPSQTCSGDGSHVGLKGGKVFETKLITINRKNKNAGSEYNDPATGNTIIPHVSTYKHQLAAIALGLDAARSLEAVPDPSDWLTKAGQKVDTKILANVLKGAGKLETAQEDHPSTKELANQLYGTDGKKVETALKENGPKNFKPGKAAIDDANKALDSIDDPDVLYKAETYYTIKKFVDEEEQKKKNQASPSCPTNTDKAEEPPKTADECKKAYNGETL
uniref:Variant surface glycoprotein 1125.1472 n=1 Tax=Trypanosoma brucei TaxID=5691 RepID=M4TBC8_9TRYP|nr:variant surface glycoprotein 1317 [Trypanosoma brucei]APD73669.1 variant surface glycoprotein 1125.1472 [Trypanosoma brucei]